MLGSKELYIAEHERLTALAEEQGMDWQEAYEATADAAYDAARDRAADLADAHYQAVKERFAGCAKCRGRGRIYVPTWWGTEGKPCPACVKEGL